MQHAVEKSKELGQVGAGKSNDYMDNALSFSETAQRYAKYGSKKGERNVDVNSVLEKIKLPSFVQDRHSMSNDVRRVKKHGNRDIVNETSTSFH